MLLPGRSELLVKVISLPVGDQWGLIPSRAGGVRACAPDPLAFIT